MPPAAIPGIPSTNYNETYNSGVTFWGLIYPYIEQGNLYSFLMTKTDNMGNKCQNTPFWAGLTSAERSMMNSVPIYFCPSRRAVPAAHGDPPATDLAVGPYFGPKGDYAIVYGHERNLWPNWVRIPGQPGTFIDGIALATGLSPDYYVGPIRTTGYLSTDKRNWAPADTMGWWSDGTSNQIVIGEKYIPQSYINLCMFEDAPASLTTGNARRTLLGDCSLLIMGNLNNFAVARSFRGGMAKEPDDRRDLTNDTDNPSPPHWGGMHTGIGNFLLGDGSVRSVSNSIPTGSSVYKAGPEADRLLALLGIVNDGNAVALP